MDYGRYIKVEQFRVTNESDSNITHIQRCDDCFIDGESARDFERTMYMSATTQGVDKGNGYMWVEALSVMLHIKNISKEEYDEAMNRPLNESKQS